MFYKCPNTGCAAKIQYVNYEVDQIETGTCGINEGQDGIRRTEDYETLDTEWIGDGPKFKCPDCDHAIDIQTIEKWPEEPRIEPVMIRPILQGETIYANHVGRRITYNTGSFIETLTEQERQRRLRSPEETPNNEVKSEFGNFHVRLDNYRSLINRDQEDLIIQGGVVCPKCEHFFLSEKENERGEQIAVELRSDTCPECLYEFSYQEYIMEKEKKERQNQNIIKVGNKEEKKKKCQKKKSLNSV